MSPLVLALLLAAGPARADSSTTALFIGDSHSDGAFGDAIYDELKGSFGRLAFFGICSAKPKHYLQTGVWLSCGSEFRDTGTSSGKPPKEFRETKSETKTLSQEKCEEKRKKKPEDDCKVEVHKAKVPHLPDLLNHYSPTHVIVALGSNPTESQDISNVLIKIRETGKKTCFWIGPPYMGSPGKAYVDGVYDALDLNKVKADGTGDCWLIDSRKIPVTLDEKCKVTCDGKAPKTLCYPDKGGDSSRTHYDGNIGCLGKAWGQAAGQSILTALGWTP